MKENGAKECSVKKEIENESWKSSVSRGRRESENEHNTNNRAESSSSLSGKGLFVILRRAMRAELRCEK